MIQLDTHHMDNAQIVEILLRGADYPDVVVGPLTSRPKGRTGHAWHFRVHTAESGRMRTDQVNVRRNVREGERAEIIGALFSHRPALVIHYLVENEAAALNIGQHLWPPQKPEIPLEDLMAAMLPLPKTFTLVE